MTRDPIPVETIRCPDTDAIEAVADLAHANLDSMKRFTEAAEVIDDHSAAEFFRSCATERIRLAMDLQIHITANDGRVLRQGTWRAVLNRCRLDWIKTLDSGTLVSIVTEIERGETVIKLAYEDALKRTEGTTVHDVLQRQYAQIKTVLNRIGEFRPCCPTL